MVIVVLICFKSYEKVTLWYLSGFMVMLLDGPLYNGFVLKVVSLLGKVLQDWNIVNGARCGLCNQFEEPHSHLLFENAYSSCVLMAFWGEIMLIEDFLPLNPEIDLGVSYFKNA